MNFNIYRYIFTKYLRFQTKDWRDQIKLMNSVFKKDTPQGFFIRTLFSNSHCFFLWYVVKSEDFIFRHQLLLENLCTLLTGSWWLDVFWIYTSSWALIVLNTKTSPNQIWTVSVFSSFQSESLLTKNVISTKGPILFLVFLS